MSKSPHVAAKPIATGPATSPQDSAIQGSGGLTNIGVNIGLNAAILSYQGNDPHILVVRPETGSGAAPSLPFGPFTPLAHRTLEIGLRAWVREQTGLDLGYVEQLYTFGDRGRHARPGDTGTHTVSIGYLALTRAEGHRAGAGAAWVSIYTFFPWEDWRGGKPEVLDARIEPSLAQWARRNDAPGAPLRPLTRAERLKVNFGLDGGAWDDERVLERYELLYEAGLVSEALRDGREAAQLWGEQAPLGAAMQYDHRRILATALGRLRGKIKYRPVIFEMMPEDFTLYELQKTVEAISGGHVHKQNFRRLVETTRLVEPTGDVRMGTGGRPAKVYRFRREILLERPSAGLRVKSGRHGS
jgi:hypothetical protein